jgi:cytochrome c biogenesis protein CcmG, thiol:disulfide interchange protein DsbE
MIRWLRVALPLLVFAGLAALLWRGMQLDPKKLPSALLNQPAPAFLLPALGEAGAIAPEQLVGRPWLLNVFASWCSACTVEHPRLVALARRESITIVGLAYKDAPQNIERWLQDHGNPYGRVALDVDGRVGIDFGVYGVPETYVIDARGIIRHRHVGPIDEAFVREHVRPLFAASR